MYLSPDLLLLGSGKSHGASVVRGGNHPLGLRSCVNSAEMCSLWRRHLLVG